MTNDYDLPMEDYRRAGLEITNGNSDVYKSLWSRRDDATLANPFGPPVRGWEEISARLDLAASNYRDGQDYEFENISTVVTRELAYTVEIERIRTRVGGSNELTAIAIRATTVFRRENGAWKVTHRHGEWRGGTTGPRSAVALRQIQPLSTAAARAQLGQCSSAAEGWLLCVLRRDRPAATCPTTASSRDKGHEREPQPLAAERCPRVGSTDRKPRGKGDPWPSTSP